MNEQGKLETSLLLFSLVSRRDHTFFHKFFSLKSSLAAKMHNFAFFFLLLLRFLLLFFHSALDAESAL
jgi:hypothetical protein